MTFPRRGPKFLSVEEVLLLHELAIVEFGGQPGVRDHHGLNSAVAQAEAGLATGYIHAFPFEMAAAYGFHLAKNHPFVDGNKRVAWSAIRIFLHKNGFVIRVPWADEAAIMLSVASGAIDKTQLCDWIRHNAVERPRLELREFFADLTFEEFSDAMLEIANSYKSGGANELSAIVDECGDAIPVLHVLKEFYVHDRANYSQLIHYIQTLCAVHRLAESKGYEW